MGTNGRSLQEIHGDLVKGKGGQGFNLRDQRPNINKMSFETLDLLEGEQLRMFSKEGVFNTLSEVNEGKTPGVDGFFIRVKLRFQIDFLWHFGSLMGFYEK